MKIKGLVAWGGIYLMAAPLLDGDDPWLVGGGSLKGGGWDKAIGSITMWRGEILTDILRKRGVNMFI